MHTGGTQWEPGFTLATNVARVISVSQLTNDAGITDVGCVAGATQFRSRYEQYGMHLSPVRNVLASVKSVDSRLNCLCSNLMVVFRCYETLQTAKWSN